MNLENIGFIHCDAQGAENFIFSKSKDLISRCKPVIFLKNNEKYDVQMYNNVCKNNPRYWMEGKFNVVNYCMSELNCNNCIERFNNFIDTLLFVSWIKILG